MHDLTLLLSRLRDLTVTIVENIDKVNYEKLETFVEERDELCADLINKSKLSGGLNEEQKASLKWILSQDQTILKKMEHYRDEASDWLLRNQQNKSRKLAYNAEYDYESMFIDFKK
ncbi:hypothetical protein [Paenibacillus agaridevorans]|uniref:hypothetical protein n=1 Tax=Paenibacillus agaridevorans TaxID=171404 RepID=UPI001BE49A39|nr:hypothetical protein [Paenibacillus agaridevorans]